MDFYLFATAQYFIDNATNYDIKAYGKFSTQRYVSFRDKTTGKNLFKISTTLHNEQNAPKYVEFSINNRPVAIIFSNQYDEFRYAHELFCECHNRACITNQPDDEQINNDKLIQKFLGKLLQQKYSK